MQIFYKQFGRQRIRLGFRDLFWVAGKLGKLRSNTHDGGEKSRSRTFDTLERYFFKNRILYFNFPVSFFENLKVRFAHTVSQQDESSSFKRVL